MQRHRLVLLQDKVRVIALGLREEGVSLG